MDGFSETTTLLLASRRSFDPCFLLLKKQAEIIVASHMGRPNEGSERTDKPLMRNRVLALHVLINQSFLVYADANTARISPHPYQLKQSGQQSIIFRATRHVVMHSVGFHYAYLCMLQHSQYFFVKHMATF